MPSWLVSIWSAFPDTAQGWTALVSSVALIWTMIAQITVWNRDRFSRGLENLGKLDERFETVDFRELRKRAASYLLRGAPAEDKEGDEALQGVLNLFETIGYLHRRKMVRIEAVWHYFASWLLPYVAAAETYLKRKRADDLGIYCELLPLYKKVLAHEVELTGEGRTGHIVGKGAVDEFLNVEAKLSLKPRPSTIPV